MSRVNLSSPPLRLALALALGLGLAACSDKPAPSTDAAQASAAAAEQAATQAAQQQAAALAALSAEELKTRGRQALREQRIYTPAGDNAMEYYLALRAKSAKPDASAESALMDLQPYAVIAAEQALTREDFIEAERLRSLIAAADPQAPSLNRIAEAITKGKNAAAQRQTLDATRVADQAAAAEAAKLQAAADAKAAKQAATTATTAAPAPAAAAPAPRPQAADPTPTPVAAATLAAQAPSRPAPTTAPPRRGADLVAVSTPQPTYPPQAQRSGTAGEVVVSFTVNSDGSVGDINIVSAKPRGVFERNVQSTLRRWKFQPISGSQNVTRTFSFAP